jgi:uncharacterized membrane protein
MWNLKRFFAATVILLTLDAVYLYATLNMFKEQIIKVQRVVMEFRIEGAILCYLAIVLGINYFIIQPKRSPMDAFLLGLMVYAIYDTTNYATLKKWSPYLAAMDSIWGGTLFALTTYLTYALAG